MDITTFGQNGSDESFITWRYDYSSKSFFDETGNELPFSFDPDKEIFTTSKGVKLKIDRIGQFLLTDFEQRFAELHEPPVPRKRIEIDEGKYIYESNPDDMGWKMEYARYTTKSNLALLKFLVVNSVEVIGGIQADDKLKRMLKSLGHEPGSDAYDNELHYAYVQRAVGNDDQEASAFFAVLKGRSMLTKYAIETSETRFPDSDSGS